MTTSSMSRAVLRSASRLQQSNVGPTFSKMLPAGTSISINGTMPAAHWNITAKRSMVSASPVLLEQKTLKLPGLGDSITEVCFLYRMLKMLGVESVYACLSKFCQQKRLTCVVFLISPMNREPLWNGQQLSVKLSRKVMLWPWSRQTK